MYKKILSAINEHLNSEMAARYAMNLAKVCDAKLYLCFIAEKEQSVSSAEMAEDAMKRIFIEAEQMGIKTEAISDTGVPARKIHEVAKKEAIDIVFASTRREDINKRFYAGTVARKISLSVSCSVALVRIAHAGRIHPSNILVPLKAKIDHIEERAYFSAKMAQAFDSHIFLFHAPEPITKFFHGEIHLTPLEWEAKLPKDISHFMKHLHRYKIPHSGRSVPGRIGKSITLEAFSKRHDLIIMGASQRSLLNSIFKGNPVEEVLRGTPCDLIILKPRIKNYG